jgi:hypothetical protein
MRELQVVEQNVVCDLGEKDAALIELGELCLALVGGGDANVVWA